ncbi:MAG TPA: type VI secretion protein ImpB [Hellea balneolensis]|uniref:DNA-directed DNA polymerase n=1 Tax=Hellea balneolensis TaxID=287478 RepID=A0A7V5U0S7_9PROT|nr:type VI secretion protein ImpB [Hellea balneolensis]
MRKPETIERLYLDFDGFFASVEQQARPALRGRPVGVVPFAGTEHTCVIACSKEAKAAGVKNIMRVREAKAICPDIRIVAQSPDLYRRAHNALLAEIASVIPIDVVKSIDELSCILSPRDRADPYDLAARIKATIRDNIGPYISCSIGFAANRHLAKIACKQDKPDGVTVWWPDMMPGPLLSLSLADIPGIGRRMEKRLYRAGIYTVGALLATAPKQMRRLWNSVTGERLWYALHGYAVQAAPSQRGMFGHGRVLSPEHRDLEHARNYARLLLIKAARRLRRAGFYAGRLWLWLGMSRSGGRGRNTNQGRRGRSWFAQMALPVVNDDQAVLNAFERLWALARRDLPARARIARVHVSLLDLSPAEMRQLDFLLNDDVQRQKWEAVTGALDRLNARYGKTLIHVGPWMPPPGGYAGGKISYTRIPAAEDFW